VVRDPNSPAPEHRTWSSEIRISGLGLRKGAKQLSKMLCGGELVGSYRIEPPYSKYWSPELLSKITGKRQLFRKRDLVRKQNTFATFFLGKTQKGSPFRVLQEGKCPCYVFSRENGKVEWKQVDFSSLCIKAFLWFLIPSPASVSKPVKVLYTNYILS